MLVCIARSAIVLATVVASFGPALIARSQESPPAAPTAPATTEPGPQRDDAITLEQIMADPAWLGRPPQTPYWSDDSQRIYYRRRRLGSEQTDWFQSDLAGNVVRVIQDKDRGGMDSRTARFNADRSWKVFERNGDVFAKNLQSGKLQQLTRTTDRESRPLWMARGRKVAFERNGAVLVRDLASGLESQLAEIRMDEPPEKRREQDRKGYLPEQQQRLFEHLRKQRGDAEESRAREEAARATDPTRVPPAWYLGDKHELNSVRLSPNGRWCLVVLRPKSVQRGRQDKMPEFVDASGYVDVRTVRPLVGTGKPQSDKLLLLDLAKRSKRELALDALPELDSDPLADVRKSAEAWRKARLSPNSEDTAEPSDDASKVSTQESEKIERAVNVRSITWNAKGDRAALHLFSTDNKDRWIATVNFKDGKLIPLMHRRDPAWINWNVGRVAWLRDQQSLHFISEESGYAHLYVAHAPSKSVRQLTRGDFVVRDVQQGPDGRWLYYKANAGHPGIYEIHRVEIASGESEQLTHLGGMNDYVLSPDGRSLLITHSTATHPEELYIQSIQDGAEARRLTETVSDAFLKSPWVAPQFVTVPSRAGRDIHARLYLPPEGVERTGPQSAVIFIHGAGYLQNAHQGWSGYFREFMFHSLLARRGFVVLDMDYRASAGYGRDWRTAIYRHMGGPEVEDLLDGRQWLIEQHGVDEKRVGLYGGSYGGFLTMMALFQHPGVFAGGAALRPVTDWAHYNHGYTSNILNTPEIDPEAYARSSPIELASGLADPLLICHGMVDDNVFFKDTARLAQRLIELRKTDWEVAIYPVEPHGFRRPSSWYDEYRRILQLMESMRD